jgi:hypothetical protein
MLSKALPFNAFFNDILSILLKMMLGRNNPDLRFA